MIGGKDDMRNTKPMKKGESLLQTFVRTKQEVIQKVDSINKKLDALTVLMEKSQKLKEREERMKKLLTGSW